MHSKGARAFIQTGIYMCVPYAHTQQNRMRIDIDSVKRTDGRLQSLDGNCPGKVINRGIDRHGCLNDSDRAIDLSISSNRKGLSNGRFGSTRSTLKVEVV